MTIREFYDKTLIELNKVEAPSLLLEDFNYFANKAVQQYTNKIYNKYDTSQQTTDDLSALKTSMRLNISQDTTFSTFAPKEDKTYYCKLPSNYLHLLNCIVEFESTANDRCTFGLQKKQSMARRLTSDMYPSIIRNAYFKPSYKCPYYFINNSELELVDDFKQELEKIINPLSAEETEREKYAQFYDNLRMEIRCGDTRLWEPKTVYIDYVKTPDKIELTWDDLNSVTDLTSKLEFPEYVCYEIINDFTKLVLEHNGDPRLETHYQINQTIPGVVNNN